MNETTKTVESVNGRPITQLAPAPQQLAPRTTPLVPENLPDAWRLSEALSRSNIIPSAYQGSPGNVLAAIMLAQELRLSPMLVMREVYFVNDRPSLYAELKIALVMREAECEYFVCVHSDSKKATFETKRRGHPKPTSVSYTIEEAQAAGLYPGRKDDSPWKKYPANMLRWRAAGWLCDLVYPDKVLGLKTREEMEDAIEMQRDNQGRYASIPAGVYAPPEQTSAQPVRSPQPEEWAKPVETQAAQGEPVKEQPKESSLAPTDNAPDPVDVLFADLEGVGSSADLDAVAVKGKNLIPREHPRRQEFGAAVNAARKRVGGAR